MTSPFAGRRYLAALSVTLAVAMAGCSRAPEAPRSPGSQPAAPAGHDDDRGGHDHAATGRDHDHDGRDHDHEGRDHDHEGRDHDHEGHDHDHEDHEAPRTLGAGAGRLAALAASVKQHLAAEAREDADAAVHDLGHLLEDLQELVRTSDLAVDAKAAATKALDELFECFDALDTALHAEPGKSEPPAEVHASVAKRIAAAIGALEAAGAAKAATAEDEAAAIIRDAESRRKKEQE